MARRNEYTPEEILGIQPGASQEEIRRAYRKAALRTHPDRVAPERKAQAEMAFKMVSQAYEALILPEPSPASVKAARRRSQPPPTTQPQPQRQTQPTSTYTYTRPATPTAVPRPSYDDSYTRTKSAFPSMYGYQSTSGEARGPYRW